METLHFAVIINQNAARVYDLMLGLSNKETYEQWVAGFNPTSTYEGNWEKGSKILFLGTDENGKKGGMVAEIEENVPNQFVSIRHYGMYNDGIEVTEGPEIENWANSYENYTFEEADNVTTVKLDLDTTDDYVDYMNEKYPEALAKLKEICER